MRHLLATTFALLVLVIGVGAARAQGVEAQAAKSNRMAMEYFDLGEYKTARKVLSESLKQLKDKGLTYRPVAAQVHINLGLIMARGFNKDKVALKHFVAAIKIDPKIKLPDKRTDDLTSSLFAKAMEHVHPTVDCKSLLGLAHDQVVTGTEGVAQAIEAKLDGPLQKTAAFVRYRGAKGGKFAEVALTKGDDCAFKAEIPADAMVPPKVEYYLIARLKDGRLAAQKGKPNVPFVINVSFGEAVETAPAKAMTEESVTAENPIDDEPPPMPGKPQEVKKGGCASCDAAGGGQEGGLALLALMVGLCLTRRRRVSAR